MFFEPVAVPLDVDHLAVMKKPIQDGGGDNRVAEEFLPVGKAFV